MAGGIAGKLWYVTLNDVRIRCQMDATLTFTTNVEEEEACKPEEEVADEKQWVERSETSRDWELTVNHRAFLDAIQMNQGDIMELYVNGDLNVTVGFKADPSTGYAENQLFVGPGIIMSAALNAPVAGKANMDLTINANGAPTFTRIPVGSGA